MFIVGTGIDLVDIKRIHRSLEKFGDQFLNRHFTKSEQEFAFTREHDVSTSKGWTMTSAALAKMFAAKEASVKAISLSTGINWIDIEVKREKSGKPYIVLHNQAEANLNMVIDLEAEKLGITLKKGYIRKVINLSLTDEPPLAGAFVVISVVHIN